MIATPPGWLARQHRDLAILHSADASMIVSYREMVRPVVALANAIERELAHDPGFVTIEQYPPREVVTHEGEYAVLVTIAGRIGDRRAQLDLGFVIFDDYYACVHGFTDVAAQFRELTRTVHELVMGDSHMLGLRRRRFVYDPPPGWERLVCGFDTTWLTPGAAIYVRPAWPIPGAPSVTDLLVAEPSPTFTIHQVVEPYAITTRAGLDGAVLELIGTPADRRPQHRAIALLQDNRYVYPIRFEAVLDTTTDRHRATFHGLLDSVQPIPRGRSEGYAVATALDYWID